MLKFKELYIFCEDFQYGFILSYSWVVKRKKLIVMDHHIFHIENSSIIAATHKYNT